MLDKYKLPLEPVPKNIALALSRGVQGGEFPAATSANEVLDNWEAMKNKALRSASGKVLITCETEMLGVTPEMVDWWFGWHLPYTERYKLWHPEAHQKAEVKEDRTHLPNSRDQYIGNVSYVDEYIGKPLNRLTISFFKPSQFGLGDVYSKGATAVCGTTADRILNTEAGHLVHYIDPTGDGSVMKSMFWLGQFKSHIPLIGGVFSSMTNTPMLRKKIVKDQMVVDLFQHCSEEMNHLAKFLPSLYQDQQEENS
ncbi:hypothetical protein V6238_04905 [Marinomonas arenicola]|uniref:DAPG hydrolase family protein n=1 Tax=Marinomonas arenicola TaxID=569601 RepID=UPI00311E3922